MKNNPVHQGVTWGWNSSRGPEHFRRCSYCGCVHPEDLVAEVGWQPDWADWKYGWPHKFYVKIPDRLGKLDYLGCSDVDLTDEQLTAYGWKRIEDLTPEELVVAQPHIDSWPRPLKAIGIGVRTSHFGKFYTEHLRDPSINNTVKNEIHVTSGIAFDWPPEGPGIWRVSR